MPHVSVLLPVRDGARFLEEALMSVFAQTERDFEVIAVDDHSTDPTPDVLDRLCARDRRLRVVRTTNSTGVAAALNRGLAEVGSPLVARMDADDVCHPRRLERQLSVLRDRPDVSGCGTAVHHMDRRGRRLPPLLTTVPTTAHGVRVCTALGTPLLHPTVVLRTELLLSRGGYDEAAPLEDLDLWLRCADADLINIDVPLLDYRVHGGNTTGPARRAGAAGLAGDVARHAGALLGEPVSVAACRLMLDPRGAAAADGATVQETVDLLGRLVAAAGEDRRAARDRALSTAAVLCATRLSAGRSLPRLRASGEALQTAGRVARAAWVGTRRRLANAQG